MAQAELTFEGVFELAEQEAVVAHTQLGWMCEQGRGMAQDDAEAERWFWRAAKQGQATTQIKLGLMHARGRGVPRDFI